MLINKNNKRVGDLVAGTIVIKEHQITLPDTVEEIKLDCFSDIKDIDRMFSDSEKDIFRSFYFSKKDRDAVINNLRVIMPKAGDAEIRKNAKEVFVNFGLYLIEFFRFKSIDLDFVNKQLDTFTC